MPNPTQYVLWGSAGHAKVLAEVIASREGKVVALFDNKDVSSVLPNVPLFIGEEGYLNWINKQNRPHEIAGLVAIGGGRGRDRLFIQALFRKFCLSIPVLTHLSAVVSSSACLGEGSQVLALANVAAGSIIGQACIINNKASIDHECNLGNGVHVAPGATLCGCVNVSNNVFIGAGAVILPRIFIGENSIIGAGAVVTRNIPPNTVVVGNPAKAIKKNNL